MGVSIHYRGRLDDIGRLPALCEEVRDIARILGWPCETLDDDWSITPDATFNRDRSSIEGHLGLKGLQIAPHPESETLTLFFDRDGFLRCPMSMLLIIEGTLEPENAWVSIKTQFAGPETHVWVIALLKHLKKRYVSDLEVSDESGYWATGNRQELERKMAFLGGKVERLSSAIASSRLGDVTNLSANEIAARIEQLLLTRPE